MIMTRTGIEWSDDFLIGIDELDYEHRSLVSDINRLHQELIDHVSEGEIKATLGQIHARMQAHFALEEHFMLDHDHPLYGEHKAEHDELLDDYTEFMSSFASKGGVSDSENAEQLLSDWIVGHIVNSDKKISKMMA